MRPPLRPACRYRMPTRYRCGGRRTKLSKRSAEKTLVDGIGRVEVERDMQTAGAPRGARSQRARRVAWTSLLLLFLCAAPVLAVVQSTGDGMGTITPPADDPGMGHVGITGNGLSGIYVGNRWMLTAAHVGEQSLTLGGVSYPAVPGSLIQLEHAPNVLSDIVLVRLATEPPLGPLVLASAPMAVTESVTMIGYAWDRSPGQICWNAGWVEINCTPVAAYRGFKGPGSYRTRWGRNLVETTSVDVPFGSWVTKAFEVQFDQAGVTYEAQGVPGDSGGAVFFKRNGQWELVGVMFAITIFDGQPHYTTAVFGQSTYAVDINWYRPQIEAIVNAPEIPLLPGPLVAVGAAALVVAARLALSRRAR